MGQPANKLLETPEKPIKTETLIEKVAKSFENMDTKKFLKTNMTEYFDSHDDKKCFGCQHCIKTDNKMIQYKYNPAMKSHYTRQFNPHLTTSREEAFNYDKVKQEMKGSYKPKNDFTTIN